MRIAIPVIGAALAACGGPQRGLGERVAIEVLDPGTAPQTLIAYEPRSHQPERFEISQKLRLSTTLTNTVLEKGRKVLDLPTITAKVRVEAQLVPASTETLVTCEVEDVTMLDDVTDPKMRDLAAKQLDGLKGGGASWRRSMSGDVSQVRNKKTANSTQLNPVCLIESVPFPKTPIGIGAKWRTTTSRDRMGISWKEVVVFTLHSLQDSTAIVNVETTTEAPKQELRVQPRTTTTLKSGSGHAVGRLVVPLRRLGATGDGRMTERTLILMTDHSLSIEVDNETELIMITKAID